MCFTPEASITTAVVEFGIASQLFYKIKDKRLYPLAVFVAMLGVYQFTEFMLCQSEHAFFWARIGFAVYTFLPMLVYHFFVNISGLKLKKYMYAFPVFFSLLALAYPGFINYTSCNFLHVTVDSLVFNRSPILMWIYLTYYIYCPFYGVYVFSKQDNEKLNMQWGSMVGVASASLSMLAALVYYLWSTIQGNDQVTTWMHTSALIIVSITILLVLSSVLLKRSKELFYRVNYLILATAGLVVVVLYAFVPNISFNYASIFCQFALIYGLAAALLINSLDGRVPGK